MASAAPSAPTPVAPPRRDAAGWGAQRPGRRFLQALDRATEIGAPLTVHWEMTKTCNLRCVHCYFMPGRPAGDLTTAEALDLLEQLAEAGTLFLNLSGGEAMARRDFFEIAEAAVARAFALRLLTNATFLNKNNIDRFVEIGLTSVDISVLGDEAAHDAIARMPGSYRRAVNAIEMLRARGQAVIVKMPVMQANMASYDHVRALADRYGTGFICDVTMVCRNDGDDAPRKLMAATEELAAFLRRIGGEAASRPASNLRPGQPLCNAGRSLARIGHDGGVYACVATQERLGSVRERPFAEIWKAAGFRKYRTVRLEDLPVCRDCEARDFCMRCQGQAMSEQGDFYGPSLSACRSAKMKLDMLARERGLSESPIAPEGLKRLAASGEAAWRRVGRYLPVLTPSEPTVPVGGGCGAGCGCG